MSAVPIAGGGRSREPGEMWNIQLEASTTLDSGGYVLTYASGKVQKCGASDLPRAVNYRSTRDPHDMNEPNTGFLTGTQVGAKGIPVFDEGWAMLKVKTNNTAIAVGDYVYVDAAGGKVNKFPTATTVIPVTNVTNAANEIEAKLKELARIVGICEKSVLVGTTALPGADKVLVRLRISTFLYNA
jgi:hypothetical protein